ncbi:hypothetical protein [Desemzia sp. FAM 23990]|uniref:hypothetical protein n=1 Tax=Desemzia sp. FAM 23990 TaxID=3259520 RepID=UPI00388A3088
MIKGTSKFDYSIFYGEWGNWAGFNKQKYSKEEAINAWKNEVFGEDVPYIVEDAFARHRAGSSDGQPVVGWWLEQEEYKTSVPVWSIRKKQPREGGAE